MTLDTKKVFTSTVKNVKTSVKKVQPVARYIFKKYKKLGFDDKLAILEANKNKIKAARLLYDVMKNLENNIKQQLGDYSSKKISLEAILGRGDQCRKRYRAVGRGRHHPTVKHRANITIRATVEDK